MPILPIGNISVITDNFYRFCRLPILPISPTTFADFTDWQSYRFYRPPLPILPIGNISVNTGHLYLYCRLPALTDFTDHVCWFYRLPILPILPTTFADFTDWKYIRKYRSPLPILPISCSYRFHRSRLPILPIGNISASTDPLTDFPESTNFSVSVKSASTTSDYGLWSVAIVLRHFLYCFAVFLCVFRCNYLWQILSLIKPSINHTINLKSSMRCNNC